MAFRLKRASSARLAVGVALLAFPLLATGTAQAAIAGANPEVTTNRPDLIKTTVLSQSLGEVQFCFDKALTPGFAGITNGNFRLGGYRSARFIASIPFAGFPKVDQTNANCIVAVFNTTTSGPLQAGDLNQYTIAAVNAGAVQATTSLQVNNADNTTLTGSTTHNGTTGLQVGPNLVGVIPDINSNTITYVEDKNIIDASTVATQFFFTDSAGNTCAGGTKIANTDTSTTIKFPIGPCGPVTDAVRAGQPIGTVFAQSDPGISNTDDEVTVPSANPQTSKPDLSPSGTVLEANGSAIDFVFDQPVANANAAKFFAVVSFGAQLQGSTATIEGTNTVRVTFSPGGISMSQFNEYVVKAAVEPGAVQGVNSPNPTNTPGSQAVGDNAGAFARGFTTSADAFGTTFDKVTGVATVMMDQRSFLAIGGGFQLLDQNGNTIPGPAGSATFPTQAAGPQAVSVQFTPAQMAVAKNLQISGAPFNPPTATTILGQLTVQQILSPTVTGSVLSRAHYKTHHVSRRALARRRAQLMRQGEARLLAVLRHHHRA